jgi:hypothetical protein
MHVEIVQIFYYNNLYLENWKEDVVFEWCNTYSNLIHNLIKPKKFT